MDPAWVRFLEAVILFCIMLLAIGGNVLVIAVIYRRPELRKTETHIFMINLSITDICVALLCMPFSIITAVTQDWIFSHVLCQLNGFLNVFFLLTSILTLTAISINKYVGVVQSTKPIFFTRKTTFVALLWVWLQAFFTALTPILGWNSYEYIPGRTQCSVKVPGDDNAAELTNCLFIIICGFVIPLFIMKFSYFKIFRTVKINSQRVRSHFFSEVERSAFLNERRITVTLFIILATFLVCWTPFSILTVYATVVGKELPYYFSIGAYWLGFFNSAMNPLIYALRTREFRRGYRQIFGILMACFFQKVDPRGGDSENVPRGRRSLRIEVQMSFGQRAQTRRESDHTSENVAHLKQNSRANVRERKDSVSTRKENVTVTRELSKENLSQGKHNEHTKVKMDLIKDSKLQKNGKILLCGYAEASMNFSESKAEIAFSDNSGSSR